MSTTEAQRRATARYLAKQVTLTVRVTPEQAEALRAAAASAGMGVTRYMVSAAEARRAAPEAEPDGDRIRLSLRADAVQGLERDGETPAQAAARILADAIRQARQDTRSTGRPPQCGGLPLLYGVMT